MVYLVYGIAFMTLTCFLLGIKATAKIFPQLVKKVNGQRLWQISLALLLAPAAIITFIIILYFWVWHSEPFTRFAHMFWVLGFWMIGTLSFFMFILAVKTKLQQSYFALISAFMSVSLTIYFTPLPQFLRIFSQPSDLVLSMILGLLTINVSWLTTYRVWLYIRH
jgi:hypothetical protein